MINKFILKVSLFLLPLFIIIIPPSIILYKGKENYHSSKYLLSKNKSKKLIGYLYNERNYHFLKWHSIVNTSKHTILSLGTSRVLPFRKEMFDVPFYNAGYTVLGVKDYLSFLESIPKKKLPQYLIVGLDHWMFNDNYDDLDGNISVNNWANAFSKYPSSSTIKNVYTDFFNNKYTFEDINKAQEAEKVGLNAILNDTGFRNDGSMYYGKRIKKLTKLNNITFNKSNDNSFERIENGSSPLEFGKNINQSHLNEIKKLLDFCKRNDVYIVAFLTPWSEGLFNSLLNSENHKYFKKVYPTLKPLFDQFEFELFNYSSITFFKSNDNEMIDGGHGGELAYQKLLIDMLKQGSKLNQTTDINRLNKDLEHSINRYLVYE